ncbi:OmpA family protein, partial [Algoriphagus kandeliae]
MKKTLTILSITAGLLFGLSATTLAQKSRVRYADKQMELMNFQLALDTYEAAYAKKPNYETALKTAQAYERVRNYDKAYEWWGNVVSYEESTEEDFMSYLAAAQRVDKLEEAGGQVEGLM